MRAIILCAYAYVYCYTVIRFKYMNRPWQTFGVFKQLFYEKKNTHHTQWRAASMRQFFHVVFGFWVKRWTSQRFRSIDATATATGCRRNFAVVVVTRSTCTKHKWKRFLYYLYCFPCEGGRGWYCSAVVSSPIFIHPQTIKSFYKLYNHTIDCLMIINRWYIDIITGFVFKNK